MAEAIRTRCKFKCVGVEDTEYEIIERVDEGVEGYEALDAPVHTDHQGAHQARTKYKYRHTGIFNQNVRLAAQYDPNKSEDLSFAEATPSGELKIYVSNPAVIGTFKPGSEYYLDLIPVA